MFPNHDQDDDVAFGQHLSLNIFIIAIIGYGLHSIYDKRVVACNTSENGILHMVHAVCGISNQFIRLDHYDGSNGV